MKEITVQQLKDWQNERKSFQLIDVREPDEREIASIDGVNIPLGDVPLRINEFDEDKDVVVYCRSGKRSATAVHHVESIKGLENLYNLKGGILSWSDEIDPSVRKY